MGNIGSNPKENLTLEEIKELEDTFNLFDDDGSGTISAEELGQVGMNTEFIDVRILRNPPSVLPRHPTVAYAHSNVMNCTIIGPS